ncbi:MAG: tetratricopeptide repeat protein [Planctomycetes bacterium]|nr:tetratricopeptide repeat protein [Planctomycetota bacterium]
MSSRTLKLVLVICLGALALRVGYVFEAQDNPMQQAPQMDARYHLEWAEALLSGEDHHPGPFFRAPLYPWFLAAALWLGGGSITAALLLQALLGALTTFLTFCVARRAFPRSGPLGPCLSALLVAANWVLIYFDGELLLPALAIPLQLNALLQTLALGEERRPRQAAITGLSWGLAAIVRPNVLAFLCALGLWEVLRRPRKALVPIMLALGAATPILPIAAYNASQGDTVLISSQAGLNLWIGNNPNSDGVTAVVPGTRPDWWGGHRDSILQAEQAEGGPLRPSEVSRYYSFRALAWAMEKPGDFIEHQLFKLRLLIAHRELGNNADVDFVAQRFSMIMRALPPSFALLFGLGLTGLLLGICRRELRPAIPAYLTIYAATIVAFFVCSRFRAPLIPILACGAGHALAWLWHAARNRPKQALGAALCAVALAGLSLLSSPAKSDSDAPGQWQLGVAAWRSGSHDAALEHFRASLKSRPDYWYAWRDLGAVLLDKGDLPSAHEALQSGLEIRPHEPQLSDLLAEVYFREGSAARLLEHGEALLAARPEHANAHYHMARAALLEDDIDRAKAQLQAGLSLNPNNFSCLFLSSRILSGTGDLSSACEMIRAAQRAAQLSHSQADSALAADELSRLGCP